MAIKLKTGELDAARTGLTHLAQTLMPDGSKQPARISLPVARLRKKIDHELGAYDEHRNELIKKHAGPPDEKGQQRVTDENMEQFHKELHELLMVEMEVDIKPLPLALIADLPLSDLDALLLDLVLE